MTNIDDFKVAITIAFDQKSSELVTTIENHSDSDLFVVGDSTETSVVFSRAHADKDSTLNSNLIEPVRNKLNAVDLQANLTFAALKAKEKRIIKTNLNPIWTNKELPLGHLVYDSTSLRGAKVQVRAEVSAAPQKSAAIMTIESNVITLPK